MGNTSAPQLPQLSLVGFCLSCAWVSGQFGLSDELGAFMAGAMISMAGATLAYLSGAWSPGPLSSQGVHGDGTHGEVGVEAARQCINSIHNVLTALFVASIGLIMSPRCGLLRPHLSLMAYPPQVRPPVLTSVPSTSSHQPVPGWSHPWSPPVQRYRGRS